MTVFAVLAGSLLYALVFAPVLGSIIRPRAERQDPLQAAGKGQDYGSMPGVLGGYGRLLSLSTRHPLSVLAVTVVTLYLIVRAYGSSGLGAQFFVDVEPSFTGVAVAAKGISLQRKFETLVTGSSSALSKPEK